MVQCGRRSFCLYTRLVWLLWWLDAAAPFAGLFVSSVVREHGRDGNLTPEPTGFLSGLVYLVFPSGVSVLFCGVLPDAGAAYLLLILLLGGCVVGS